MDSAMKCIDNEIKLSSYELDLSKLLQQEIQKLILDQGNKKILILFEKYMALKCKDSKFILWLLYHIQKKTYQVPYNEQLLIIHLTLDYLNHQSISKDEITCQSSIIIMSTLFYQSINHIQINESYLLHIWNNLYQLANNRNKHTMITYLNDIKSTDTKNNYADKLLNISIPKPPIKPKIFFKK